MMRDSEAVIKAPTRLGVVRRVAVITVIVSLSITALIGIVVLLGGEFSEVQSRIMLTTLIIGVFSIIALADLAVAGRRLGWVGYLGVVAAAVGLVMALILAWGENFADDGFWKAFGVVVVLAGSLAHANLLLLLAERRHLAVRVGLGVTVGLIALLAGMLIALVLTDSEIGTDTYLRVLGTVAILDVLGTVVVPVVSRFLRDEGTAASATPAVPGLTIVLPSALGARLDVLAAERSMPAEALVIKTLEDLVGADRA